MVEANQVSSTFHAQLAQYVKKRACYSYKIDPSCLHIKKIFLSLDCLFQNGHNHYCTATDDSPPLQCSLQRLKVLLHFHTHQYDIWVRIDISIYPEYSMKIDIPACHKIPLLPN